MAKTLEQKMAALSPARRKKVEARTAELIEDERSLCDLRRALARAESPLDRTVDETMTSNPVTIPRGELAASALSLMEARKITSVVVTAGDGLIEGVLHIHDLWRTQLF